MCDFNLQEFVEAQGRDFYHSWFLGLMVYQAGTSRYYCRASPALYSISFLKIQISFLSCVFFFFLSCVSLLIVSIIS